MNKRELKKSIGKSYGLRGKYRRVPVTQGRGKFVSLLTIRVLTVLVLLIQLPVSPI